MLLLNSAAATVLDRLDALDLSRIEISNYTRRYLQDYRPFTPILQQYVYLLALALAGDADRLEDAVLVDYGGGSGLLSSLARAAGVGTVIYTDIYDVSCHDARVLARAIGTEADEYLHGDLLDVLARCRERGPRVTAVTSSDVIEHVYDVDSFFAALPNLSSGRLSIVMASAANRANPLIYRDVTRVQRQVELEDRAAEWGHKERDSLQSYRAIRREMVCSHLAARGVSTEGVDLERLVAATRGLAQWDIECVVDRFLDGDSYPSDPEHPTNTCDPYTGNWAEHLMNPRDLAGILGARGMSVRVMPGYYGRSARRHVRLFGPVANAAIRVLGARGLSLAPYYVIAAQRTQ